MKILHSADWHLDSPIQGRSADQTRLLRQALLQIPGRIAALCRQEKCDMVLLAGDLFDGAYSRESCRVVRTALEEMAVPVFIAPGNHDFAAGDSPWLTESWPENVHVFTKPFIECVEVPALSCRVYGAGFTGMDCPGLLENFRAEGDCAIGVLHGDPTQTSSPYCPVTQAQVKESGLNYLALGHIHKGGSFRAGDTLCAWPGCPMGRGYDEQGEKGVLIVTVDEQVSSRFVPLEGLRFYDLQMEPEQLDSVLPPVGSDDFYRITLTGESEPLDIPVLLQQYARFPNLELRDQTVRPVDPWAAAGEDSFEGTYFKMLQQAMEGQDEQTCRQILLAAKISRKILDGQEVVLP